MKRFTFAAVIALLLAALTATSAQAVTNFANAPSGAHYAKGASEPVCTLDGLTVSCTGTAIQGVGNTNAVVTLAVTSTFTGYCHNPGSKDKIVDPFTRSDTNTTSSVLTPSRNGRLDVDPKSVTGESSAEFQAGFTCPNANWTSVVTGTSVSYLYTLTFAGFTEPAISIAG